MSSKIFLSMFSCLLLSGSLLASAGGKKKGEEETRIPERMSFQDFSTEIIRYAPYVTPDNLQMEKPLSLIEVLRDQAYNKHFKLGLKDSYLLKTDLDKLREFTGETDLLDAHEKVFDSFAYNEVEANFQYPYAIASYWDILPHPPIPKLERKTSEYSSTYAKNYDQNPDLVSYEFNQELNQLTKTDISYGNDVKLLLNGEFYPEKLKMVKSAKKFIFASNMFLTCDYTLTPLIEELKKKIKQGVKVYYILDQTFAIKYGKCFKRLRKLGVEVVYLKNGVKLKNRIIYHNKFWIVDDEAAIVYGANLLDVQVRATGFNHLVRDTGILIKGPVVRDLTREYIAIAESLNPETKKGLAKIKKENQQRFKREKLDKKRGLIHYADSFRNSENRNLCRVVFQGENNMQNVSKLYGSLINNAKHNIFIAMKPITDEFSLETNKLTTEVIMEMIRKANEDGVRVDMLTNNWLSATDLESINYKDTGVFTWLYNLFIKGDDMRAVVNDTRKKFKELTTNDNFKIWNYFQFTHSKTLMVDNTLSVIGSYNLNKISADTSYEMAVVCHDKKLNQNFSRAIVLDLINSIPLLRGTD